VELEKHPFREIFGRVVGEQRVKEGKKVGVRFVNQEKESQDGD